MEDNSKSSNYNGEGILKGFDEIEVLLVEYVESLSDIEKNISNENTAKGRPLVNLIKVFILKKIPEYRIFVQNNIELFENPDFAKILINEIRSIKNLLCNSPDSKLYKVYDHIERFREKFEVMRISVISFENANNLIKLELVPAIAEVKEKVKDFESLRLALEQRETSSIYLSVHDKYRSEFLINNALFFLSLFSGAILTLYSTSFSSAYLQSYTTYSKVTTVDQWFILITIKVLIITLTITLCTLFLRRSAHAKKLYEQAYQTHVEINAFPIHVRSLKEEDKHVLIKELAMKYFGKELDQTQNDKIGDLMKDQLTAGTELIKASAELVKAKG